MMKAKQTTRREFLKTTSAVSFGALASSILILPRNILGSSTEPAASEKINIASIGLGGRGTILTRRFARSNHNIVALCDVDDRSAEGAYKEWPDAKRHRDFRKMLDEQKDIDAVVIATPDHLHFAASMWALKNGKHVYCEKPLTHTVAEARLLAAAARDSKVATQMGNQGNANSGVRIIQEWIEDGAIGAVREVHCWVNESTAWVQGIDRPTDTPPVPQGLDWDLWLGPAPKRPYHPAYLPIKWNGWWAFGSVAIGAFACHVMNTPWRALNLGTPFSIEAYSNKCTKESGPLSSIIYYEFPARGSMPPVRLTWYDGGLMPPRPAELPDYMRLGDNAGCVFVGETGKIICGCYGDAPRLLPLEKMKQIGLGKRIPRSPGHDIEWLQAIKGGPKPGSHFEHAAVLTEVVQLGNVATRTAAALLAGKPNGNPVKILWDAAAGKVTNVPEANQFLQNEYRQGWV